MRVDCNTCEARGMACADCVVTVLLGDPRSDTATVPGTTEFDPADRVALAVLADGGLLPPLRLVEQRTESEESSGRHSA